MLFGLGSIPAGWKGLYKNKAEELVEIKKVKTNPSTEWCFSAAATVLLEGIETRIECAVPKNLFDVDGVQYEVEPGWQDIVRCLKKAILVWPQSEIEEAPINEGTPSAKESPRRSRKAPSSSDVELASLLDIANHGVEESNLDERQEKSMLSQFPAQKLLVMPTHKIATSHLKLSIPSTRSRRAEVKV